MRIEAILASIAISAGLAGRDADLGRLGLSRTEAAMTFRGEILGPLLVERMLAYLDRRTPDEQAGRRALLRALADDGALTLAEQEPDRAPSRREEQGRDELLGPGEPDSTRSAEASLELIRMMKKAREAKEKAVEK